MLPSSRCAGSLLAAPRQKALKLPIKCNLFRHFALVTRSHSSIALSRCPHSCNSAVASAPPPVSDGWPLNSLVVQSIIITLPSIALHPSYYALPEPLLLLSVVFSSKSPWPGCDGCLGTALHSSHTGMIHVQLDLLSAPQHSLRPKHCKSTIVCYKEIYGGFFFALLFRGRGLCSWAMRYCNDYFPMKTSSSKLCFGVLIKRQASVAAAGNCLCSGYSILSKRIPIFVHVLKGLITDETFPELSSWMSCKRGAIRYFTRG
ncbi:hypothetical protein IF1G_00011 [Cordyceps javanica]|uniref:Uncharacterized protein n=1 Tax=Cordyceps javanica TaxID=43265 RepID=A0A545VEL7_9HYPO|nr:hypothetical protein IF1G_00011 [Cordyceps javanica]